MKRLLSPDMYLPFINGLIGDTLAKTKDPWTIQMSFRVNGKDVPPEALEFNLKNKPFLVFVHGLMADELIWSAFDGFSKDYVTLYVRYNTGLHISENGHHLNTLLEKLNNRFKMKTLFLLGHSMGGLVIRSACHYGHKEKAHWVKKVPAVFLIAVPNAGAALEKISHATATILNRIAHFHTGTVGNIIEQRSNGIKDLRLGSMLDEDWKNRKDHLTERASVPPIPGIHYHILVGTLSADDQSLMAKYFGDGLVTHGSAVADTLLKVAIIKTFVKTGHNSILKNSEVIDYIGKKLK